MGLGNHHPIGLINVRFRFWGCGPIGPALGGVDRAGLGEGVDRAGVVFGKLVTRMGASWALRGKATLSDSLGIGSNNTTPWSTTDTTTPRPMAPQRLILALGDQSPNSGPRLGGAFFCDVLLGNGFLVGEWLGGDSSIGSIAPASGPWFSTIADRAVLGTSSERTVTKA
ncbi:MAG: hypothetical protein ACAF42_02010 [Limnothrix sp. BL-A-16]